MTGGHWKELTQTRRIYTPVRNVNKTIIVKKNMEEVMKGTLNFCAISDIEILFTISG